MRTVITMGLFADSSSHCSEFVQVIDDPTALAIPLMIGNPITTAAVWYLQILCQVDSTAKPLNNRNKQLEGMRLYSLHEVRIFCIFCLDLEQLSLSTKFVFTVDGLSSPCVSPRR
jgi:hypothetical protein